MRGKKRDYAAEVGAVLATLFMGCTLYGLALLACEALADKLCAWLNAVIAIL